MNALTEEHTQFIKQARHHFEHPSLFIKLTDYIGKPIELLVSKLPEGVQQKVSQLARISIEAALRRALQTFKHIPSARADNFSEILQQVKVQKSQHNFFNLVTGGVGGFLGGFALAGELPLATVIILRSIAKVASEFGFDPSDPHVQLECLNVFALGGASKADDAMDSAYFAERLALAKLTQEASAFMQAKTAKQISDAIAKGSAPLLIRFITKVAERFKIAVSAKLLTQTVPILGAVGGASVNVIFSDHFVKTATYHFGLKRLEKIYGEEAVKKAFYEA